MREFSVCVFLLLVDIPFQQLKPQPIRFSEENIEILINDEYAIVNGKYTFRNKSNEEVNRTLFYPFPINQFLTYPDRIEVFDQDNKIIPFSKSSSGMYFSLIVPPKEESIIKVTYSQKLLSNEMKYILTTTQNWKSPLQKAEYKISLPLEFELKGLSLKADSIYSNSTYNIYYINKENFMPDKDLIIKWIRREK